MNTPLTKYEKNNNARRIIALICVLVLTLGSLAGCQLIPEEKENKPTDEELIARQYDDLVSNVNGRTADEILSYIEDWALSRNIPAERDSAGNLILKQKPTAEYNVGIHDTVLCCNITGDMDKMSTEFQNAALGMYTIEQVKDHGGLTLAFTKDPDSSMPATKTLKKSLSDKANIICITSVLPASSGSEKDTFGKASTAIYNSGAEIRCYELSKKVKYEKPKYNKAFRISIFGIDQVSSAAATETYPSAAHQMSNLLSFIKSKNILFQLASLNAGKSPLDNASRAEAVIVINDSDIERVTKILDKDKDQMADKYDMDEDDPINYVYSETVMPEKVLKTSYCDSLMSALYTLPSGVYDPYETGRIDAIINTGYIKTTKKKFVIGTCIRSLEEGYTNEIDTEIKNIALLTDSDCEITYSLPAWTAADEKGITAVFLATVDKQYDKEFTLKTTFEVEQAAVLNDPDAPESEAFIFNVNSAKWNEAFNTLKDFLEAPAGPSESSDND